MDHIAILNKSWHFLNKIVSGEKTIESRWYNSKISPWDKIKVGETVYFKNAGGFVSIKAEVVEVLQFSDLTTEKVKKILGVYYLGIGIPFEKVFEFAARFSTKRYCVLVFLKNVRGIVPFSIDKSGFGLMSAWLCVDDINNIKK